MSEPTPIRQPEPDAPTPSPAPRSDIEYVVLARVVDGDWKEMARVKAKNPDAAIEDVIGTDDPSAFEYVAVAGRYWSPQRYEVKVETVRTLVPKAVAS